MNLYMIAKKDVGFWGDSLSLVIYQKDPANPGVVGIASPLFFTQYSEGSIVPAEATIGGLKLEAAVRLMDSLWEAGVRPSGPSTSQEAEIRALKAHIEDLRKLLWNRMGVEAT